MSLPFRVQVLDALGDDADLDVVDVVAGAGRARARCPSPGWKRATMVISSSGGTGDWPGLGS
jgi:hypothetical protein